MEFLHLIGLCPDHFFHVNFLDIFLSNYTENIWFLQKNILHLCIIKRKWQQKVNTMMTYLNGLSK